MNTPTSEWRWLPVEPTPKMMRAAKEAGAQSGWIVVYNALLAASPAPDPLTDDEILKLAHEHIVWNGSHEMCDYPGFARAILSAQAAKGKP